MVSIFKKILSFGLLSLCIMIGSFVYAEDEIKNLPAQASIGMYIQHIGDFNFVDGNFSLKGWLWYVYDTQYSPLQIEQYTEYIDKDDIQVGVPIISQVGDKQRVQIQLDGTVKQNRQLQNFPFDRQTLHFSLENGNYDSTKVKLIADNYNSSYQKDMQINGWNIDSFQLNNGIKTYESTFGDPSLIGAQKSEYDNISMTMEVSRQNSWITFLKIFIAPYLAFIICYFGHFIAEKKLDARVGIATGALFATISNKYIVDSILPQSTGFTLIDQIHTIVLAFIFFSLIMSIFAGKSIEEGGKVDKFDYFMVNFAGPGFIVINIIIILIAIYG